MNTPDIELYINSNQGSSKKRLVDFFENNSVNYNVITYNRMFKHEDLLKILRYNNDGIDSLFVNGWQVSPKEHFKELRKVMYNNPTIKEVIAFVEKNPNVLKNNIMYLPKKKMVLVGANTYVIDKLNSMYRDRKRKLIERKVLLAKALELGLDGNAYYVHTFESEEFDDELLL
jgi:arsenate reductase-like glutaredoxin family protein